MDFFCQRDTATVEQLFALENLAEVNLPPNFIRDAVGRGDWCYAFIDGFRLGSYGWCSQKPTKIDANYELNFCGDYVYMYKGFTSLEYRGQRLHAVGMLKAAEIVAQGGNKGLIAYVEAGNY